MTTLVNMEIKMRFLICTMFMAVISIFSCCSLLVDSSFEQNYEKIADAITNKTAEKFKREKALYLIGIGGGMMDDIKMMSMDFNYYREVDFDAARALLVYCVEEYLAAINGSEEVRPYLHNYPFTAKNIEIRLYFYKPNGRDLPLGKLSIASAIKGTVKYKVDNPNGYTLDTVRTETYEEALQIVQSQTDGGKNEIAY
jgi:hypothetical protein